MKIESQIITPDIARQYLEKNCNVRSADPGRVSRYANSIRRGEWVTTHQGIAFNAQGHLVDGQHRLMAIVESNRAVELMVAMDVCEDAVAEMDRNIPRDNSVLLGMHRKHAEIVTHIARIIYGGAPSRCALQAVKGVTESAIIKLYEQTTTAKKALSTAPVKSAFVTAFLMSPDESILENYRKLVLLNVCDIEELSHTPASIRALYQRLIGVKHENKRAIGSYQVFAYTLNAIKNPTLKKVHNINVEQTHKDVRQFYRNIYSL